MEPTFALKIENKVRAIVECNVSLKQKRLSETDINYTLKVKQDFLNELKILLDQHPDLSHHPALLKIESDLKTLYS